MWPFKKKIANHKQEGKGPLCSYCLSTHTIVKSSQGAEHPNYIKTWRGQRFLTCRCLNCGKEFYAEEPPGGLPETVMEHAEIVDDEDALREAEDEIKRRAEDENDRRCW